MSFLDELIFSPVRKIKSGIVEYTSRPVLSFPGATLSDDGTTITVDVSGGGGDPTMGGDISGVASAAVVETISGNSGVLSLDCHKVLANNLISLYESGSVAAGASESFCAATINNQAAGGVVTVVAVVTDNTGSSYTWRIASQYACDGMGGITVLGTEPTPIVEPSSPPHTVAIVYSSPGTSAVSVSVTADASWSILQASVWLDLRKNET